MALPGGYILWAWVGLSLQFPLPSLLTCRNEDDMIDNMPVWHCSYAADHYSTLGCRWSSDAMNKYQTSVIGCYNVSRSQCRCHNVGNASELPAIVYALHREATKHPTRAGGGGLLFGARMIESGTHGVHSADPPMIPGYTAIARGLGYLYCHPIPAYVKLLHTA